ncbi:hypothetical protein A9P44_14315 [Paenibacillus polymyxa]|nr:hypothetical protein [Paenibacillus polymyxa]OBA05871.1 hypothetical protein A9P44_14315 [Paenibacillus polymyxa]
MKKYQKTAIAVLSTMAMLLAPIQAAFADEAVTTTNPPSQEIQAQEGIDLFANNPLPGYFNQGFSVPIYLTGSVEFTFTARAIGTYVFEVYDMNGELKGTTRVNAGDYGNYSTSLSRLFRGYHRISATSPDGSGTFNIRY